MVQRQEIVSPQIRKEVSRSRDKGKLTKKAVEAVMHCLEIKKLQSQCVPIKRIHRLQTTSWEYALGRREIHSLEISDLEIHELDPQQIYSHPVDLHVECRQHVRENDDTVTLSGIMD
jgi:hypothetical protein